MRSLLRLAGWLLGVAVCLLAAVSPGKAGAWENRPLEIGLFPYLSTHAVLNTYRPLRAYLEKRLQRPVVLITAPDLRTFVERTQKGEYRFVIDAPHFARLAQTEAGYVPMLRIEAGLYGVVVVAKNSSLHDIAGLRGKVVSTPNEITLMSMLGLQLLRRHGLTPGRDVFIHQAASHNSAVLSVLRGESAAAVTSVTALRQMPPEIRNEVRILAITSKVPHVIFLANSRVPQQEVAKMTTLLLDFAASPEGKQFIRSTGYAGLRPPTDKELRSLDPYVRELKALLSRSR